MQSMNEIMYGMTAQERDLYLAHQSKRAKQEVEYWEHQRQENQRRRKFFIESILKKDTPFTREKLEKLSLDRLIDIDCCY